MHFVEHPAEALEQRVELGGAADERRREAEDVVAEGAEDDAVAQCGARDALAGMTLKATA